ncbi:MAG: hypothetical protein AB7G47_08300 [Mycolicibacterium sp.]|uniref:hypothetical protein n=1 Tax=Mycolicibacterium sp. TaxID=2320850 RepID=UPI003D09CFD0
MTTIEIELEANERAVFETEAERRGVTLHDLLAGIVHEHFGKLSHATAPRSGKSARPGYKAQGAAAWCEARRNARTEQEAAAGVVPDEAIS